MQIDHLLTDDAILVELGRRITAARLQANLTQAELALAAGVSKRTVERLEAGEGAQLANLVRCLRALNQTEGLDRLVPPAQPNPIDLLRRRTEPRRVRASRPVEDTPSPWRWGDEE